jgi:hypothetical protein
MELQSIAKEIKQLQAKLEKIIKEIEKQGKAGATKKTAAKKAPTKKKATPKKKTTKKKKR